MGRPASGCKWYDVKGRLYARLSYTDPETGKRKDRKLLVQGGDGNYDETLRRLLEKVELEKKTPPLKQEEKRPQTYAELAARFMAEVAVEAKYDASGVKQEGMRSRESFKSQLSHSLRKFGRHRYEKITYPMLKAWRLERLGTPVLRTKGKTQRSLATVHRELTAMQRVLRYAVEKGWLVVSPFTQGPRLVNTSAERMRQRILSREECVRLVDACRDHDGELTALVVVLLHTGARLSEARRLLWSDLDFAGGTIRLFSYKSRRCRERLVPMTSELRRLLTELRDGSRSRRVFKFETTLWKTFCIAASEAGIRGADGSHLRMHDLRHTYATRLVKGEMSLPHVGKLLGHSSPQMTYRYVGTDEEVRARATEILEQW
jgi:integrase